MPASGPRHGNASRSANTASAPKTTTSAPERTAQVSRQARANATAAITGRYNAIANHAKSTSPSRNDARSAMPRPGLPIGAGPTSWSQDHEATQGKLSRRPPTTAAVPTSRYLSAVRHGASASMVDSVRTTTMTTATTTVTGVKAAASATTMAANAVRRSCSGSDRCTSPSAMSDSALRGSAVSTPTARRIVWIIHGTAAYVTSVFKRPVDMAPTTSGLAA